MDYIMSLYSIDIPVLLNNSYNKNLKNADMSFKRIE